MLLDRPETAPEEPAARLFSHLVATLETWHARVTAPATAGRDFWPVLSPSTWEERLDVAHARWRRLVQDPTNALDQRHAYTNSKGEAFETALEDIIMHLIIHGQHHRAQISVHLRAAGVAPPATDYIYFTRALGEED